MLQDRLDRGRATLKKVTLDPADGRYWNRLYWFGNGSTGGFYKRDIPSLLYPLIAGVPARTVGELGPLAAALRNPEQYNLEPLAPDAERIPNVMPGVSTALAASSAAQLSQFWSGSMSDNDVAAHPASVGTTIYEGHRFVRTEAVALAGPPADAGSLAPYASACNDSGTVASGLEALQTVLARHGLPPPVPLWRYYSHSRKDTLTSVAVPSMDDAGGDYERQGLEAYCLSAPIDGAAGTELTLWYSYWRQDYQTCGTAACRHDARMARYRQVGSAPICYAWSPGTSPAIAPLPSVARDDPAFQDNTYWRGRTWGPMVYLTYQGMWRYRGVSAALDGARQSLVERGRRMLLVNWSPFGHVFENSNGTTGYGADAENADPFYHWGALAGYIGMREAGLV